MKYQKYNSRRYFGSICKYGHIFAKSWNVNLRYKSTGACCMCVAIQMTKRKAEQKIYRDKPENKKKAIAYGKEYRRRKKKNDDNRTRNPTISKKI